MLIQGSHQFLIAAIKWIIVLAMSLIIGGCSNFISSTSGRPSFPLPFCNKNDYSDTNLLQSSSDAIKTKSGRICTTNKIDNSIDYAYEISSRKFIEDIEEPFREKIGHIGMPKLGIALSGGGTKSAAFSSGVLAGMYDNKLIESTDYISSVSGGGYAAYHFYSQILFSFNAEESDVYSLPPNLYRDCTRKIDTTGEEWFQASTELNNKLKKFGQCSDSSVVTGDAIYDATIRSEGYVRCQQDILDPGHCDTKSTYDDFGVRATSFMSWIGSIPASWVVNTVFDSGIKISDTAKTYHDGIGMTYGTVPDDEFEMPNGKFTSASINCKPNKNPVGDGASYPCENNFFDPDPIDITYDELRRELLSANKKGLKLPLWIIDATSTKHRSGYGWFATNKPALEDIFEMTPVSHGSDRYGYVNASADMHNNFSVLDSVTAAAAFFDANEQVLSQPIRAGAGVLIQGLNLNWGTDISNYNVSDARAGFHRYTPMPLNWLDTWLTPSAYEDGMEDRRRSAYIRLADGGNSDDLGLYSQIKRNVRNIVVADAANDSDGVFSDICRIKNLLEDPTRIDGHPQYMKRYIYLPGLNNFADQCRSEAGYDIRRSWKLRYPVLLGCVRNSPQHNLDRACTNLAEGESRLFVIKPALDEKLVEQSVEATSEHRTATHCWLPGDSVEFITNHERAPIDCDVLSFLENNSKHSAFPQHSTVTNTIDSSYTIYSAYRGLARQYTYLAAPLLKLLVKDDIAGGKQFDSLLAEQYAKPVKLNNK